MMELEDNKYFSRDPKEYEKELISWCKKVFKKRNTDKNIFNEQ